MKLSSLDSILPECKNSDIWTELLNNHLSLHGIETPEQTAMFIAQVGHESGEFSVLEENLNYGADGLLKTFPKYFKSISEAFQYARSPVKIANKVYANRMGNGDESSGEGYKFRGRGLLQITGKENYTKCSLGLFGDKRLVENPDLISQDKELALMTALWYWDTHNLSSQSDITDVTQIINGGQNGIAKRIALYNRAIQFLTQ